MSVRHALLALLSEGPKYGLQLHDEFERKTGDVWPLNVGQVYSTLQRLERSGLVASRDESEAGPQKDYRITELGEHELASWLTTPPDLSAPPRDEVVMKVMVAIGVRGVNEVEVIQLHRRYMVEVMQEWTHLKTHAGGDDLNFSLIVDSELFRLDALIRWLDAADGRLARAAHDEDERHDDQRDGSTVAPPLPTPRRQGGRR